MNLLTISILQGLAILNGMLMSLFLIIEPLIEGRNAHATLWEIYAQDTFLFYTYGSSLFFFLMLKNIVFLLEAIKPSPATRVPPAILIRHTQYFSWLFIGTVIAGELIFIFPNRHLEDSSGGVFMGFLAIGITLIWSFGAKYVTRRMQI